MRDSPNEDMLVASLLGPIGSIIELPRNREMRTVMRYVYGAVAFIGVAERSRSRIAMVPH